MADVVIGAAYGDEGKGNTVNALATPDSMVVRFSGGANAGHTAKHNGKRYVFGHLGSGTLKGAATYLSRFFVCNPALFLDELWHLDVGIDPEVYVSHTAPVTTPYDVAINIMAERTRGKGRHGSVGVGLGETVERGEKGFALYTGTLECQTAVYEVLGQIVEEWVPQRCEALGIKLDDHPDFKAMIEDEQTAAAFMADCDDFMEYVKVLTLGDDRVPTDRHVIFEGSQGLILDQNSSDFPHVTRANTGLTNVLELTDQHLDVYYVTRAYTTRHGAGPLPHELHEIPYPDVVDETNVDGPHQGHLRYSYLNIDRLAEAVELDRQRLERWMRKGNTANTYGVVTCMDQVPSEAHFIHSGLVRTAPKMELAKMFSDVADGPAYYIDRPDAIALTEVLTG